mgnify:CR=1 FL=1
MEKKIQIRNPAVGLTVGRCKNCNREVRLRQPWLSKQPVVNDGWYLVHCMNEECHNYTGMELRMQEMQLADFIRFDKSVLDNSWGKVIDFNIIKGGRCV